MDKTVDSAPTTHANYKVFYFSAPWCTPCQNFSPLMEKVSKDYPVEVVKLNIDDVDAQMLGMAYGVKSVPHVTTAHSHQLVGAVDETVLRAWFAYAITVEQAMDELNQKGEPVHG